MVGVASSPTLLENQVLYSNCPSFKYVSILLEFARLTGGVAASPEFFFFMKIFCAGIASKKEKFANRKNPAMPARKSIASNMPFPSFKYARILIDIARLTGGVGVPLYTETVFSGGDGRPRRIGCAGGPHGNDEALSRGAGVGERPQPEGGGTRLSFGNRVRP